MDNYVEVSSESWISRISGAIKGLAFGGILFLTSFSVLFFNEGRAVDTYKSLVEGARAVKSVQINGSSAEFVGSFR
jgi:tetrahydromethanopterin S-methyltransferase subunit E